MQEAVRRGLLDDDPSVIRATSLGCRFLNDLQALFLREHAAQAAAVTPAQVDLHPVAKDSP
jgi:hypothetical protein